MAIRHGSLSFNTSPPSRHSLRIGDDWTWRNRGTPASNTGASMTQGACVRSRRDPTGSPETKFEELRVGRGVCQIHFDVCRASARPQPVPVSLHPTARKSSATARAKEGSVGESSDHRGDGTGRSGSDPGSSRAGSDSTPSPLNSVDADPLRLAPRKYLHSHRREAAARCDGCFFSTFEN
jgi:hypothetical protein